MKKVLFICIHNSARSQMAEEILRQLAPDKFITESAGIEPGTLNPFAIKALKEIHIDISHKKTRSVNDIISQGKEYDYVITLCDETSAEKCPVFPTPNKRLHWGFDDPSAFEGADEEKLNKTIIIRDQIKAKILDWLSVIN